jgi:hypothetical protein
MSGFSCSRLANWLKGISPIPNDLDDDRILHEDVGTTKQGILIEPIPHHSHKQLLRLRKIQRHPKRRESGSEDTKKEATTWGDPSFWSVLSTDIDDPELTMLAVIFAAVLCPFGKGA